MDGDPLLQRPPFSEADAPEIIGTAVAFHYINRMVDIFLDETPLPSNRNWLKGRLKRVAGIYFSRAARRQKVAGGSLALLPEADLPADLGWAAGSPAVTGAFARWAAVVEMAGREALSANVRALVSAHVAAWNGEAPSLSRNWVEAGLAGLDDAEKPGGSGAGCKSKQGTTWRHQNSISAKLSKV